MDCTEFPLESLIWGHTLVLIIILCSEILKKQNCDESILLLVHTIPTTQPDSPCIKIHDHSVCSARGMYLIALSLFHLEGIKLSVSWHLVIFLLSTQLILENHVQFSCTSTTLHIGNYHSTCRQVLKDRGVTEAGTTQWNTS